MDINLNLARKYVWDTLRALSIAQENDDTARAISYAFDAGECLKVIIDRSKQPKEVEVAQRVMGLIKDGYAIAAFNYVSAPDVHYHTGSPTRLGWKDLA